MLEHFLDPLTVLKRIRETLSEKGILYIAVPNNLYPIRDLHETWFRAVHTYYFNRYSLKNLLHLSQYSLLSIAEGDELIKGDMFLFATTSSESQEPEFSRAHYIEQSQVFKRKLKADQKLINRIKNGMRKVKRTLVNSK